MLKPFSTIIRFILVALLLGVLFSYAMFQGGFVSWFLFFGFLPILLYSVLIVIYPLSWLKVERDVSKRYIQAGHSLKVSVKVKSHLPLPILFLIIEDQLPKSISYNDTRHFKYQFLRKPSALFKDETYKTIIFPRFRRQINYQYEITSVPRGLHELNDIRLLTGDFLGLVKKERVYQAPIKVLSEPREVSLKLKNDISYFEEGEQSAYSIKANHTNLVSGVRDYAPGDRVSWLDWKTTAKKQKLVTKEFEQEKHKDLAVILNRIQVERDDWLAFEGCVEIANSIVRESIDDHGNVSFVAIGNHRHEIQLERGRKDLDRLTRFLAETRLEESEQSFSSKLLKEGMLISKDRNIVVMTHQLDSKLHHTMTRINQQDAKVSLILIKSKHNITSSERQALAQLRQEGVIATWLSEDQLTSRLIEVNT